MKITIFKKKFPSYTQFESKDCGPTCIKIICKYYGRKVSIKKIRDLAQTNREGTSLLGLYDAAEKIGLTPKALKTNFKAIMEASDEPFIVHWNNNHFVVVYRIFKKGREVYVSFSDPGQGLVTLSKRAFLNNWIGENADEESGKGIVLLLRPNTNFATIHDKEDRKDYTFLLKNFFKYKKFFFQLLLGIAASSALTFLIPFITQATVDVGIQKKNLNFIYLMFAAQILIYLGGVYVEIVKNWILLHISTKINISLISDFFVKLMKLPISYFDTRITSDIMQRIHDHGRVENILTNSSLNVIFSFFSFIIYSIVLLSYNYLFFVMFISISLVYMLWVLYFMKKRKAIDYENFALASAEQAKEMELINGMKEIKLFNAEKQKRWEWELIQVSLFQLKVKSLSLDQWQSVGGGVINQIKNFAISFYSIILVFNGEITLGMMISIQFIVGQLSNPFFQLIQFMKQFQDARFSLERIGEIHEREEEERADVSYVSEIPQKDIVFHNVSFKYPGANNYVFENLNLRIPYKKTTAIVGISGSGKSTLLKMLMMYYDPTEGEIKIGNTNINMISPKFWRQRCGTVMQDGYIFDDTIAKNISLGHETIDQARLEKSVEIANIKDYIEGLPLGYNTYLGGEGVGLSGGQKQRIFIARAIYKSPDYIFFDEATSSLDSNNEKKISDNLYNFFKEKTAVIIAHRLSTVKNADKIIVIDKGVVIEEGSHHELIRQEGCYFDLVRNQLV